MSYRKAGNSFRRCIKVYLEDAFQYSVNTLGRLTEEGEFEDIIVKTGDNGQVVRLRDVARVELGALDYGVINYATDIRSLAMPVNSAYSRIRRRLFWCRMACWR